MVPKTFNTTSRIKQNTPIRAKKKYATSQDVATIHSQKAPVFRKMIIFVTALLAEAQPLIDFLKLKQRSDSSYFPIYQNEDVYLIVSGIGKMAAASACSYWHGKLGLADCAWLNVGIAGHRHLEIGSLLLAHKVIDSSTQASYYPTFLSSPSLKTYTVCSVDTPKTDFTEDVVFDMEAFGFIQAAQKSSPSELVHSFKIISDNEHKKIQFHTREVHQLIKPHVPQIYSFALALKKLANEIKNRSDISIESFVNHWHFTVTQKHQMKRIFQRFIALKKGMPSIEIFSHLAKAEEVIYDLEQKLQSTPLSL